MSKANKKKKRGRRPGGGSDSRETIVAAARSLFARHGYRGTTMRAVARRAKIDVALVHYFFHSKDELFTAAIELPVEPDEVATLLTHRGRGARMARFHVERVFVERREAVAAILRSAIGDPSSVPALRKLVVDAFVMPPARVLRGKHAKLRAELAGALLIGLFVCRHLIALEPLAGTSSTQLVARLAPALDALLAP